MSDTPRPGPPASSLDSRIEGICVCFEDAWKAGGRPSLQQYLDEVAPEERAALFPELLKLELYYRRLKGEQPTPDDYRPRFPNDRDLLQLAFTGSSASPNATIHYDPSKGSSWPWAAGAPRYVPVRFHAKGGLGEVHAAHDAELGRTIALKRIQDRWAGDGELRRRFLAEAEITGRLEHPGVVPVYGLVQGPDGEPCYAMRFIDGETLQEAIRRFHAADPRGRDSKEQNLALRQLLGRFVTVCNTIAYAHSRGIVHRDLKPSNVMLGKYGETLVVDWGLAKQFERDAAAQAGAEETLRPTPPPASSSGETSEGGATGTQTGTVLGTPAYMSPEQAWGELDRISSASDIFALGAILYALLTNRVPFDGESIEALEQARRGEFPPPRSIRRGVPPALEAICLKAMALRPADRYASALILAADVERWLADEPLTAYREPLTVRARRWGRRHRPLVVGWTTLLVMAVVLLTILIGQSAIVRVAVEGERERLNQYNRGGPTAGSFLSGLADLASSSASTAQGKMSVEHRKLVEDVLDKVVRFERVVNESITDEGKRAEQARFFGDIGRIFYQIGQVEKGADSFRRTVELYEKLDLDYPARGHYRVQLADRRQSHADLLVDLSKLSEAEAEYRNALALWKKLVADFPDRREFRTRVPNIHARLGSLLYRLRRQAEAGAAYRRAIELQVKVTAEFPKDDSQPSTLASYLYSSGVILDSLEKFDEAEVAFRRAIELRERLPASPVTPFDRLFLTDCRTRLAITLAHAGHHAKAASEAGALVEAQGVGPRTFYNAACVFGLSSAAAKDDAALAERYAARAVTMLRQAFIKGWTDIAHMVRDSDLDSLRRRPDFADLLWDLADLPPPAKPATP
jgi:serine/threonine protein kinase